MKTNKITVVANVVTVSPVKSPLLGKELLLDTEIESEVTQ